MDVEIYKKILKEKKMTYEDLAQRTGLSLGCIKRIMAGIARYPRVDTIELIEKALEIDSKITPEERVAGASETKKISITPIEDEMLYLFREIGYKHGVDAQRALITVAEKML